VLVAAGDAIDTEGSVVDPGTAVQRPSFAAWLFRPQAAPSQVGPDDVPQLLESEEHLVWVDLSEYSEEELRRVATLVGMDEDVVRSALSHWQRPRLSMTGNSFSVSVTVAELDSEHRRALARELDLMVGDNILVSAHKQPLPFYTAVFDRARTDPDLVRLDSGFMLYIVLDELLAHYEGLEEYMRGEIEQIQGRALRDNSDDFLEDLLRFKRYAFALAQLVLQHQSVFQTFLRPDFPYISGNEISAYFRDLDRRLLRLVDRLGATRQEVNNTFDIYLSHQSQRTNDVMKALTVVATILFSATFIEGIFGPSFHDVPTHDPAAFVVMLALIAVTAGITVYLFRRRGWM
jgi:magnesium transporter